MTKWVFLALLMVSLNQTAISYAQETPADWQQRMESINREAQLRREKSQLEFEKSQLEFQKMEADSRASIAESRAFLESLNAEQKQNEAEKISQLAAQAQEEVANRAEEAATEVRSQLEQAEVRHKNQIFLGVAILSIAGFLWTVVRKSRRGGPMRYYEKFGIVVVIVCGLLILFVLMISQPWVERLDVIQNMMTILSIQLFPDVEGCQGYGCTFTVDFPTKYAVLSLLTLAAYGFTTYLGITPALKKKVSEKSETKPIQAEK
jgi:hypothetical protein